MLSFARLPRCRRSFVLPCALALATLAGGQNVQAAPTLYISTDQQRLFTVDPQTQLTTLLGSTNDNGSPVQLWDIAFSPSGDLYGVSSDDLYSVNATNGSLTRIGAFGGPNLNALVFSDTGVLYAAGGPTFSWADGMRNLYTVNTLTGAATQVGSSSTFNSSGDLAFLNGVLYITSVGSTTNELFTVNPTTAAASFVGLINTPYVFGIGADGNTLYGAADGREVLTINTTSGAGTVLFKYQEKFSNLYTGSTTGMAIRPQFTPPVSAPGPIPIAGIGATLVWSRKLRRRLDAVWRTQLSEG